MRRACGDCRAPGFELRRPALDPRPATAALPPRLRHSRVQTAATLLLLALALLWPALVQQRPAYFFDTAGYLSNGSKAFAIAHDKLVAKLAPAPDSDDDDRAKPARRVSNVVSIRAIGGFDTRYARPSIEDIELGVRLNQAGYGIALVPEALGKHCKDWGKRQLWRTDIMSRAVPWTQLIAAGRTAGAELNLVGSERLKSVLAHLSWLLPLAALVFHFNARLGFLDASPWHLGRWLMGFGVASGLAYVWLNRAFLALLYRAGGLKTMVLGLGLHWLYHCYASVTFALVMLRQKLTPSTTGNAAPAINPMPPQAPPR